MLDLDDVRLVTALASEGSARRAAALLGRHVATLYRQLHALEGRLGSALFERGGGAYSPTPFAAEIVQAGEALQITLDELGRRAAGQDNRLCGRMSVTTTDTLFPIVAQAVAPFCSANPALTVDLSIGNAMADMTRHDADVAIRPTVDPPENLIGQKLGAFTFARYAATPDMADWIDFDDTLSSIPAARWLRQHMKTRPRMRCNSLWAAMQAATAGVGWALLPGYLVSGTSLVRCGDPIAALRSTAWMLYHPDLRRVPRVRYFARDVAPALVRALRTAV